MTKKKVAKKVTKVKPAKSQAKARKRPPSVHEMKALLTSITTLSPPPAPRVKRETSVCFLIDDSGSMSSIADKIPDLMSRQLDTLDAAQTPDDTYLLSFRTFGTHLSPNAAGSSAQIRARVARYNPRQSSTALRDAMITSLLDLRTMTAPITNTSSGVTVERAFLLIVLTDGDDNASRNSSRQCAEVIHSSMRNDNLTIAMMVPPSTAQRTSRENGVPLANITEWEATKRGVEKVSVRATKGLLAYTQSRKMGMTHSTNYFDVDVGSLKTAQVKAVADDVTTQFRRLKVEAESPIKSLIESKGIGFIKGNNYYEMTKPETLQSTKDILVQKRGDRVVWGGAGVRGLIGLPTNIEIKVKPKNFGEWRLFVRSDSDNRKLVRGTELLVLK